MLLAQWILVFVLTVLYLAALDLWASVGVLAFALATVVIFFFTVAYNVLVERLVRPLQALRPQGCSIYDRAFWRHERFWKMSSVTYLSAFNGTPYQDPCSGGCWVRGSAAGSSTTAAACPSGAFTTIGDDCTLNAGSIVQCHSQEDGGFKSDRIVIGAGCTLGVGALVHYGVTMGDGAVLATDSFLMKGEEMPPNALWGGNPAKQMPRALGRSAGPEDQHRRQRRRRARPRQLTPGRPCQRRDDSMDDRVETGRKFWRAVLLAGGATAIPRWTLDPAPGVAEHVATLDDDLAAAVRRLADGLELPLHSVALAAHAKVLAALSGEQDVVTGYAAGPGGRPLPCPLTTEARSWRSLLRDTSRVESDLLRHRDFPVDELKRELGVAGPAFETEFDPVGSLVPDGRTSTDLTGDSVLRVALTTPGGRLALRLRYRTDALDADSAERIAGYHLPALALMVGDPGAEHERASLLSDEEMRFQLDGLAGRRRELPDRRFHELFEQRVRMHPDAVAAVYRDRQWTYRELNGHANRLARALLARGLRREGVVAVVTERNLDWMASVLAVFKAGGAYLPIEPHFPADRIGTTLARAECTLVLTELGSTTMLDKALDTLPDVQKIIIEEACAEGHRRRRPGRGRGGRSARLHLFHLRLHRRAQGGDVRARGDAQPPLRQDRRPGGPADGAPVVAQTAPQCFDISLWQLVSALLVGGEP